MATTVNSDMVIYNDLAQTAYLERVQEVIEVFNGASNGALTLINENIEGDYKQRAFYKIGGAVAHRDVNSTAAVTATKIGHDENISVKVPFKYGPYATTEEAFKRRARSPEEFSTLLATDYADALLQGYFSYLTAGLEACISANSNMVVGTDIAPLSIDLEGKKVLTAGLRAFGDRAERLRMWMMDSTTYFDLYEEAIDNKVFNEADTVIYGGQPGTLGRPVLVTDKAPTGKIFGLQEDAVIITESQVPGFRSYNIDNEENLAIGFRAEGAFNLEVLGYSYLKVAGENPNLVTVADSASWEKKATSDKATAGVLIHVTA